MDGVVCVAGLSGCAGCRHGVGVAWYCVGWWGVIVKLEIDVIVVIIDGFAVALFVQSMLHGRNLSEVVVVDCDSSLCICCLSSPSLMSLSLSEMSVWGLLSLSGLLVLLFSEMLDSRSFSFSGLFVLSVGFGLGLSHWIVLGFSDGLRVVNRDVGLGFVAHRLSIWLFRMHWAGFGTVFFGCEASCDLVVAHGCWCRCSSVWGSWQLVSGWSALLASSSLPCTSWLHLLARCECFGNAECGTRLANSYRLGIKGGHASGLQRWLEVQRQINPNLCFYYTVCINSWQDDRPISFSCTNLCGNRNKHQ